MQLDEPKHPRNYLARREQWRLLLLVVALGVVIILANEARQPRNWRWLWGESARSDADDGPAPRRTHVDNRLDVQPLGREAAAGVRIDQQRPGADAIQRPTEAAASGADDAAAGGGSPSAATRTDSAVGAPGTATPSEPPGEGRGDSPPAAPREPRLAREELAAIRDDTYFRNEEAKAWFALLDMLRQTDDGELERRSLGRVAYVQLFRQPNTYRGELVTVVGTVRRAHRLSAPRNDVGIERYYQLWLQPADNPSSPMVIYCLGLPEGFPTGMELAEDVRITGFFFKRWAYRAADTLRTAPTLLAKTVAWSPAAPSPAAEPADPASLPWIVATALLLSGLVAGYVYYRTRPAPRGQSEPPPEFDRIAAPPDEQPSERRGT